MPKKNFSTAGMDLLGLRGPTEPASTPAEPVTQGAMKGAKPLSDPSPPSPGAVEPPPNLPAAGVPAAGAEGILPKEQKATFVKIPTMSQPEKPPSEHQKLVRKSYYVTPGQHKALKIKAANGETEEEKDISTIIRNAIDQYLAKNR